MSKYAWAILDHYSSTVEDCEHDNCPPGEKVGAVINETLILNSHYTNR